MRKLEIFQVGSNVSLVAEARVKKKSVSMRKLNLQELNAESCINDQEWKTDPVQFKGRFIQGPFLVIKMGVLQQWRGRGSPERQGGGGFVFKIENPRKGGGGSPTREGGARGPGVCLQGMGGVN